jgi:hypothetical protein
VTSLRVCFPVEGLGIVEKEKNVQIDEETLIVGVPCDVANVCAFTFLELPTVSKGGILEADFESWCLTQGCVKGIQAKFRSIPQNLSQQAGKISPRMVNWILYRRLRGVHMQDGSGPDKVLITPGKILLISNEPL